MPAESPMAKPRIVASGVDGWWVRGCWPQRAQQGPSWAWFATWRQAVDEALGLRFNPAGEARRG